MTELLVLVTIILGFVLADTRKRLRRLEGLMEGRDSAPSAEKSWSPAVIVDRPQAAATEPVAEVAHVMARSVEVAPVEELERPDSLETVAQEAEPVIKVAEVTEPPAFASVPQTAQVLKVGRPVEASITTANADGTDGTEKATDPQSSGFEDLFGRKLPIWAGGITLVVAAVLLVKYSIDSGLLAPWVRIMLGTFFGFALIGGAEIARRKADAVRDDRIPQALAGAGVGSLYAATLAAANLYGLIGPGTAFACLTAVTAGAMLLATRFGAPTALLGLVGGLATPALVSSTEPNVPLLAGYLALVIGGLTLLSRQQRWFWLGVSALVGGGAWTAVLIAFGGLDQLSGTAIGLLVLLLGIALPFLSSADRRGALLQVVAAVVAALQLALLVATGGYDLLSWGLYGLLSIAFVWLAGRVPVARATLTVPLLASLLLAAIWPEPGQGAFTAVILGMLAIFGGSALWRLWRADGAMADAGQINLAALGGLAVSYWQFASAPVGADSRFALIALGFGLLPAAGATLGWARTERHGDRRFLAMLLAAGLFVLIAAVLGLANWTIPVSAALVAAAMLLIGDKAQDRNVRGGALGFFGFAILALLSTGNAETELEHLVMAMPAGVTLQTLLRWGTALAVGALFSWRLRETKSGYGVQAITALLGYGLIAQFIPASWLAIVAALAMLASLEAVRRAPQLPLQIPAIVFAALAGLWALEPLARWLSAGLESLAGEPMLVTDLPTLSGALQRLLVPALIGTIALWRQRLPRIAGLIALAQMSVIGLIGLHILYKQLFAIGDMDGFIRLGLAERTLWELLLIGAGLALWRLRPERNMEALALVGIGVAHNALYTLLLHNPLWDAQAVGPLPLINLLLPAFGIAFAAPSLIARLAPDTARYLRQPAGGLRMLLLLLFAIASLRQIFAGSLLTSEGVSASESILWSVAGIALGVGFLIWGIRSGQRIWRIGSLLLMLGAAGKVFLIDASGLEGLLRIVSFLALGFSLIGIGWLYSRYLKPDAPRPV